MSDDQKIRDRRAGGRIQVSFAVEITDISFSYPGTAVDLSPGGLRVRMGQANPPMGADLDLVLRPAGEAPIKMKGRVMHAEGPFVGVAFAVGEMPIFEAALNLYESTVMRDPKLAIRLKARPTTLEFTQKLYPVPLRAGQQLSGPEHWVYGLLKPEGTLVWDLRRAIAAEWTRVAFVPFALLERGLVSLQPPAPSEEEPAPALVRAPLGRTPTAPPRNKR